MNKKLKIIGVLSLILVFAFTLAACDNNTQSSLNDEVEETGDLIVTASVEEAVEISSEVSGGVETQSVIEGRFSNFDVKVRIKHKETGREKIKESNDLTYGDVTSKSFSFENIITGNWDIYVTVKAEHDKYGVNTIASEALENSSQPTVTVEGASSTTKNVKVKQELGGLNLSAGEGIDSDFTNVDVLELRKPDGNSYTNPDGTVYSDSNTTWTDIEANQYNIYVKIGEFEHSESIMVLPGITKGVTINYYEGDKTIDLDYAFPPSKPTGVEITTNGLEWATDSDAVSYNIVRREKDPDGRHYWETIATDIVQGGANYPYVDNKQTPGIDYEYAVVAVNEDGLTSDYSNPVSTVVSVSNESDLNTNLSKQMISTINVADSYSKTTTSALTIDRSVNIVAETEGTPKFTNNADDGTPVILVQADDVTIDGLNIVKKQDTSSNYAQGIKVDGSNVTIKNNIVEGSNTLAAAGIDVLPSTNNSINNITIAGNDVSGFDGTDGKVSSAGIKVCSYYSGSTIGEVTIEDNTTSGNTWGYLEFGGSGDINGPINLETNSFDDGLKTLTNEYASVTNENQLDNVLNDEIIKEIDFGSDINYVNGTSSKDLTHRLSIERGVTINGNGHIITVTPDSSSAGVPAITIAETDGQAVMLNNFIINKKSYDKTFAQGIAVYADNVTINDVTIGTTMLVESSKEYGAGIWIGTGSYTPHYVKESDKYNEDPNVDVSTVSIDQFTRDNISGFTYSDDAVVYDGTNGYWLENYPDGSTLF